MPAIRKQVDEAIKTEKVLIQTDNDLFVVKERFLPGHDQLATRKMSKFRQGFTNPLLIQNETANIVTALPKTEYSTLEAARKAHPGIKEIDITPVSLVCDKCGAAFAFEDRQQLRTVRVERDPASGEIVRKIKWCRSHDLFEKLHSVRR